MSNRELPAIALALTTGLAFPGVTVAADYTDTARVVSVTPIIEQVREARQECTPMAPAPQRPAAERSVVAPIIGGVAGALLGSTVGKGRGRDVATAAGAIAGTIVGDRVGNPNSDGSVAGAAVGGAAGGLLGSQVGRGNGRTAATATGAIVGAVAGDRVATPRTTPAAPVENCRTVESVRDVTRGYTVVYEYNGHPITTTLPNDPGQTVRIGITALDSNSTPARETLPAAGGTGKLTASVRDAGAGHSQNTGAVRDTAGRYNYRY